MNSETSTRYGSRVRRHGRSRAARAHQANKRRVNCVFTSPRSFVFTPYPSLALLSSPPIPLSHFCPHPLSPSPQCGEGGRATHLSFPLSTTWRGGQGVRTTTWRGGQGVRTRFGGRRTGHAYPRYSP